MRPTNPINAECATLKVPENWDAGSGRQIELAIALVPSRSPKPAADPVFILAGGPGQSARESWRMLAGVFNRVLANRHVILLDQRGTGASNRFDCPTPVDVDPLAVDVDPAQAAALARACIEAVKDTHDARYYSTEDAARDLDRVRAALGAEQHQSGRRLLRHAHGADLHQALSGSGAQLLLDSVVPNELMLGTEHAINLEDALQARNWCAVADDAECGKNFG